MQPKHHTKSQPDAQLQTVFPFVFTFFAQKRHNGFSFASAFDHLSVMKGHKMKGRLGKERVG